MDVLQISVVSEANPQQIGKNTLMHELKNATIDTKYLEITCIAA